MSQLTYKTKGNSQPGKKPRVYFSAHPDDYEEYFQSICADIFATQDCVIWYDNDPLSKDTEYNENSFFADLEQMHLFVFPITYRFLKTSSRALDKEFDFAIKHHIPILPLMQEVGLEDVFNRKCGSVHFLINSSADPTSIPYPEKLEKYLSSVLVSDETNQRIKSAFDAFTFLSYRKKDRSVAQKLMKLIHQDEMLRDVAIWYDEFLTPGEDFNDSIQKALQQSDLFTLVVTPNIINENNYIVSTEYPVAKTLQKKILPVEMIKTDQTILQEKCADIPRCISSHDKEGLHQVIIESLGDLPLRSNQDPTHNYLIGLAYLHGINVERDFDRAVQILTDAANNGLLVAIRELVNIYKYRMGDKNSYASVISWQKKLIETTYEECTNSNGDKEDLLSLITSMLDLAEYYQSAKDYTTAQKVLLAAKVDASLFMTRYPSLEGALPYAKVYKALAQNYMFLHENASAQYACSISASKSRSIIDNYQALPSPNEYAQCAIEAQKLLTECNFLLGDICVANGEFSEAISLYRDILPQENENKYWLSYLSNMRIADTYMNMHEIPKAREAYSAAFEALEIIKETSRSTEITLEYCSFWDKVGFSYESEYNFQEALKYYKLGLEKKNEVLSKLPTVTSSKLRAYSYLHIGICYGGLGDHTMFIVNFTKSTQIYAKLADSLDTIEALSDMADVYQHFSRISLSLAVMNNSSSLVSLCQNAIEWELEAREEIVFKTGREEILTYAALGTEGKDPKEILKNYWLFSKGVKNEALQAEITWDMVLKSGFGERKQRYYLAECYYRHAQFLFMEQKYEKAHEQIGKCQMINEQLIETSEIPEAYRNLSESHQLLCEIFLSQNHVAKSKKHVKEAIKLRKHLVNLTETIESAYLLADSYFLLGKIEKKVHLLKEAHAIIASIITQRPNVTLYARELQEIEAELESIKREKSKRNPFFPFFSK